MSFLGGDFFDHPGQFEIFLGDSTGVMGGEGNVDLVVDVSPVGVVVHLLGVEGNSGHEAKGSGEIGKAEGFGELAALDSPGGVGGSVEISKGLGVVGHAWLKLSGLDYLNHSDCFRLDRQAWRLIQLKAFRP